MAPEPAAKAVDTIDEQIASLLEIVSSEHEAEAEVVTPDARLDGVAADAGLSTTSLPKVPRRRRRARGTKTPTGRRGERFLETVTFYNVKTALAIVLYTVAVGFLIVYLMSSLGQLVG